MTWIKPPALKPGDAIRLVAPAGPVPQERAERGIAWLKQVGYLPVYREDAFERNRYLAGSDTRRLEELHQAFADPDSRAIMAFRGGFGVTRLLPQLDVAAFRRQPKALIGFSDISALHLSLFGQSQLCSLHGPQVVSLPDAPPDVAERLFRYLGDPDFHGPASPHPLRVLHGGEATGRLIVSNLSLLGTLVGTPFLPDLHGAILVLEDVNEAAYRLDRVLTQVHQAGVLATLAGLVLADLRPIRGEEESVVLWVEERLLELCRPYNYPILSGLRLGHLDENWPLPCGVMARLSANAENLLLLEGMVRHP